MNSNLEIEEMWQLNWLGSDFKMLSREGEIPKIKFKVNENKENSDQSCLFLISLRKIIRECLAKGH